MSQLNPNNVNMNNQELVILTDRKFSELCAVLGVSKVNFKIGHLPLTFGVQDIIQNLLL